MKSSRLMTLAMVGCAVAAMAACTRRPVAGAAPTGPVGAVG